MTTNHHYSVQTIVINHITDNGGNVDTDINDISAGRGAAAQNGSPEAPSAPGAPLKVQETKARVSQTRSQATSQVGEAEQRAALEAQEPSPRALGGDDGCADRDVNKPARGSTTA